jgi:hypothetical protein
MLEDTNERGVGSIYRCSGKLGQKATEGETEGMETSELILDLSSCSREGFQGYVSCSV